MSELKSKLKESIVFVKIDFDNQVINQLLNYYVDEKLNSSFSIRQNDTQVKLVKYEKISLSCIDDQIKLSIPLKVYLEKSGSWTGFSSQAQIVLHTLTNFKISENFQLSTQSSLTSLKWLEYPTIKKGFLKLPLKWLVRFLEKKIKTEMSEGIDNFIKSKISLHQILKKILKDAYKTASNNPVGNHYINFNLLEINNRSLSVSDSSSHCKINFKGHVDITDHKILPITMDLPTFLSKDTKEKESSMWLYIALENQKISSFINAQMRHKEINIKNKLLHIENVSCDFQSDAIHLKMSFSGDYEGAIVVSAIPALNAPQNKIELNELRIELESGNLLLKSIFVFLKPKLKQEIKNLIESDFNRHLDLIQDNVDKIIAEKSKDSGLNIQVRMINLKLDALNLDEGKLELICHTEFNFQIGLLDARKIYDRFIA